jgi:alpha-1,2-mannosyltransferase
VVVGLVAAAALATALLAPGRRGWFDVGVYWGTAHWWRAGGGIYDYLRPGTGYGFTYPPFALLCLLPLALVSRPVAVVAALAVNLGCAAVLLHALVRPLIRERHWHPWYALAVAASLAAVCGPVRDTISFGQVNLVLLALVWADLRTLRTAASGWWPVPARWAGIGIGLAAAVKLTPLLFIGYALVVREWRLARVAAGTFAAATLTAWMFAPGDSARFWTRALWQTGRVGDLGYASNQSLLGVLHRLGTGAAEQVLWLLCVLAVLAWWAARVRGPGRPGLPVDHQAGFALTGVAACLVSPVSWVHHLVWLLPALILVLRAGLGPPDPVDPGPGGSTLLRGRRWGLLAVFAAGYLALSTGLVWVAAPATGLFSLSACWLVGANAGVWTGLLLLATVPVYAASHEGRAVRRHRHDRPGGAPRVPARSRGGHGGDGRPVGHRTHGSEAA